MELERKGVTSGSVKDIQTYASQISDDVNDSSRKSWHPCIEPVKLNPSRKVSDQLYLEGDRTQKMATKDNWRKENVEILQTVVPESLSYLKQQDTMCVKALQNIERREKLSFDYQISYQFVCKRWLGVT